MVVSGRTKGVLLRFRDPSLVPLEAVGARKLSINTEVMAATSGRGDMEMFVKCVVMFCVLS
jgi:hypothetical protein